MDSECRNPPGLGKARMVVTISYEQSNTPSPAVSGLKWGRRGEKQKISMLRMPCYGLPCLRPSPCSISAVNALLSPCISPRYLSYRQGSACVEKKNNVNINNSKHYIHQQIGKTARPHDFEDTCIIHIYKHHSEIQPLLAVAMGAMLS